MTVVQIDVRGLSEENALKRAGADSVSASIFSCLLKNLSSGHSPSAGLT